MELLKMRPAKGFNYQAMTLLLVISTLVLLTTPHNAHAATTFGGHTGSVEDMRVKVLGGYIRVNRSWESKGWRINRRWDPVGLHWQSSQSCWTAYVDAAGHTVPGGCVGHSHFAGFQRNGVTYSLHREVDVEEADGTLVTKWEALVNPESYFIARIKPDTSSSLPYGAEGSAPTVLSLRWENMGGDWIEYEKNPTTGQNFRPVKYGDKNNVTVTFAYDTNENLLGVSDHLGKQILWYEYDADGNVKLIKDYSGRKVEYGYNAAKQLTSVTDLRGFLWGYTYNSQGYLESKTDPNNNKTTYSYTANNAISSVTDPLGNKTTYKFEYDKTSKEFYKQEKTPGGKITETWYNANGDILRESVNGELIRKIDRNGLVYTVTGEDGNKTIREVNQYKQVLKVTHPDGSTRTTTYAAGTSYPLKKVDENGVVTLYAYDASWNLKKLTEAAGKSEQRITTYTYDNYGNNLSATVEGDAASKAVTVSAIYDSYGNAKTKTNGAGSDVNYTYDVMGNALSKTRYGNHAWIYTYDSAGSLLTYTEPTGYVTTFEYDKVGNRINVTNVLNVVTQYQYDQLNRLSLIRDSANQVTRFKYNLDGHLIERSYPSGAVERTQYDSRGRVITQVDVAGNKISRSYISEGNGAGKLAAMTYPTLDVNYVYDQRGNIVNKITNISSAEKYTEAYSYDFVRNKISLTDAKGRTTHFSYDALSRLANVTDAAGGVTRYKYNSRDSVYSITNANDIVIRSYTYDGDGRRISEISPTGSEIRYRYDDVLNVVTRVDAMGQAVRFYRDPTGRVDKISYYAKDGDATPTKTITYTLDEYGRPTAISDGGVTISRTYTALGKLESEKLNYGNFSLSYKYVYDLFGRKKSLLRPEGVTVDYNYNQIGQLIGMNLPGVGTISWSNDQWGLPTAATFPGGSTVNWSRDSLLRPKAITAKDTGDNVLSSTLYDYDAVGNISSRKTEYGDYIYNYDKLDRLKSVTNPTLPDESYAYDAVGNRLSDASQVGDWIYENDNRLMSRPGVTYAYDLNGSLVEKNDNGTITRFTYDVAGRMTEVRDANDIVIASYTYDPFGRRIKKVVNGVVTYFLYSEEGVLAEADESGVVTKQYGWKPNSVWGTEPVYMIEGESVYYYQTDHLGTPYQLISGSGAVKWAAKYESFGAAHLDVMSVNNPLRLPGQYYDKETGMHYNYFRDYDPLIGRYIESDPIGLNGGYNTYVYAYGNPVYMTDPSGLLPPGPAPEGCSWHFYEDTLKYVPTSETDLRNIDRTNRRFIRKNYCIDVPIPVPTPVPQPQLPDPNDPNQPPINTNPGGQINFTHLIKCSHTWYGRIEQWRKWEEVGNYSLRCTDECGNEEILPGGTSRPTGNYDWRLDFADEYEYDEITWHTPG